MELAIDTSSEFASIALSQEGRIEAEHTWHSGQNHTVELVPAVTNLLQQMRITIDDISAIFVARGPGSFNGLRVGVSTAKGLAFAGGIPVLGISTLEVEAYAFAYTGLDICPVHNAGRGEIAAALYRKREVWECLIGEHITTVDKLCASLKEKTVLCGEIAPVILDELRKCLGDHALVPDESVRVRRAGCLAELGWQRLNRGEQDDPAVLQPIYLRKPPITQPKNRPIKK